jgi:hypothetical protein
MILVTPRAPGNGCTDLPEADNAVCWYRESYDGTTSASKIAWSRAVVDQVLSQYDISLDRVVIAGYSSGAQWTMEFFGPQHAVDIMSDGVAVAISYGGRPQGTDRRGAVHKANVPYIHNTGDIDQAWTLSVSSNFGVKGGQDYLRTNGFITELELIQDVNHTPRDGQFGLVMEKHIKRYVPRSQGAWPLNRMPHWGAIVGKAAGTTTTNVPYAPGVQLGDFLLLGVASGGTGSFTASGWTAVPSGTATVSTTLQTTLLYKFADSSDVTGSAATGGTLTVTGPSTVRAMKMARFPGTHPTTPFLTPTIVQNAAATTHDIASQTPDVVGCLPVWFGASASVTRQNPRPTALADVLELMDTYAELNSAISGQSAGWFASPPLTSTAASGTRGWAPVNFAGTAVSTEGAGVLLLLRPAP